MKFDEPMLFEEAIAKLTDREIVTSRLRSAEWRDKVAVGLRERAFFSATVENARVLQTMQDYLADFMSKTIDPETGGLKAQGRSEFVAEMRELCEREGIGRVDPETGEIDPHIRESDLTDLRSMSRLQLIFDTQTEAAHEYGYWSQGNDPDILDAFPAQRFIRVRPVITPRPLHAANEGAVRRKDDLNFWLSMNEDFGVPWGPWGFNSGMGVEDVDRIEAEELGILAPGERIQSPERGVNDRLSASVRNLSPEMVQELKGIFGDQVREEGGRLQWKGKPSPQSPSTNPQEALAIAGIRSGKEITVEQARALIAELREDAPFTGEKIAKISGALKDGTLTQEAIRNAFNDFVSLLPPSVVDALPEISFSVRKKIAGALGDYNATTKTIRLNRSSLLSPQDARKTIFHELFHWLHEHNSSVDASVRKLWEERTKGGTVQNLLPWNKKSIRGLRDEWLDANGDEYAGRIYPWEVRPKGTEVLTRHLEKLSAPEELAKHWNHKSADGKYHWRDAFTTLLENLYE